MSIERTIINIHRKKNNTFQEVIESCSDFVWFHVWTRNGFSLKFVIRDVQSVCGIRTFVCSAVENGWTLDNDEYLPFTILFKMNAKPKHFIIYLWMRSSQNVERVRHRWTTLCICIMCQLIDATRENYYYLFYLSA